MRRRRVSTWDAQRACQPVRAQRWRTLLMGVVVLAVACAEDGPGLGTAAPGGRPPTSRAMAPAVQTAPAMPPLAVASPQAVAGQEPVPQAGGASAVDPQRAAGAAMAPDNIAPPGGASDTGDTRDAGTTPEGAPEPPGDSDAAQPDPDTTEDGLWIAPDGDDSNPGTEALPLASLNAALARGDPKATIWVAAGTYRPSDTIAIRDGGSEDSPLQIFAAGGARPVFDFSAQPRGRSSARGFQISASYVHVRGLDIINAGDNCIHISGSYNTIEHVVTHGCEDTGVQISANSSEAGDPTRAAHNTIVNCDSYDNYDAANRGENADGFAAKLYIGPGNVFRGCRAWNNADDGWDLFASDDVVVIEDCWAIANGKIGPGQDNTNGDGNGFKLGGRARAGDRNMGGAVHEVRNCVSLDNRTCGFTRNNNTQAPQLSMCGGRGDGRGTFCSLTNRGDRRVEVTATEVIAATRDADGNLPPL
ncbi:MAG: right-handed parallel beta-helix repeat-containing protein [Myxococcales bacterium]|nr:right-handed parallel beta-helix repeat-containing protein [Myxococcales bacterium]